VHKIAHNWDKNLNFGQNVKLVVKLNMKLVQRKKKKGGETHNYTKIGAFPSLDENGYIFSNFM
jgi:uncharacterized protein involved in tolerance to divalent cations